MNIEVIKNNIQKYYRIKTKYLSTLIKKSHLDFAIISILISIFFIIIILPELIIQSGYIKSSDIKSKTIDSTSTQITPHKKQILFILDKSSDSVTVDQAYQRNQFLVSTLQQHQAIVAIFENAAIDNRNQVRLFYITLLAAMITIFVIKDAKKFVLWCTLAIILSMYWLDVHFSDLYFRHHEPAVMVGYTQDSLVNISPSSKIYNNINMNVLRSYSDSLNHTAISRKLSSSISPNLEQQIFYIVPLTAILSTLIYYLLVNYISKKKIKSLQKFRHITRFPSRPHLRYGRFK